MQVSNNKFQGGSWNKSIKCDDGTYVVLGMSYYATNRGTAFARNVGYASVQVELYIVDGMGTYEDRDYLLKFDIKHCRDLSIANKYARKLIRETGLRKIQKVIAEGIEKNTEKYI